MFVAFNTLLMETCNIQLDRLVKEFIVPLEKQISSEQEEKQVVENETREIVGQKRRARGTAGTSSSASKEQMVADSGTRRSKRVKVAPTRYFPIVEEESLTTSPHASSCVVTNKRSASLSINLSITMHTTLTDSPPLENSILETGEATMNDSNEDTNIGSSRRVCKTFDERFKDLMAFKAQSGHCNVPQTRSRNNKHSSLGQWCSNLRRSYKDMKEGGISCRYKISTSNIKRLENAGFQWSFGRNKFTFDERFKDLMAFKAEFGHCNVSAGKSRDNKQSSLGAWCSDIRRSYKAMKGGGQSRCKISKADIQRLENAGFEWNLSKKVPFNERFKDLMAFKAKFGHFNVPRSQSSNNKYLSLGQWCNDISVYYRAIQEGREKPRCELSKANMKRLEKAGFKWRFR
jgi:hypothetical protein